MTLKIYNSLTKEKEEFKPLHPGEVRMYVCGPTVYDEPHIGHLRSVYVFEVIQNYFKYSKYKVNFARNVTDVDDKIIEKAQAAGSADLKGEVAKVAETYLDLYKKDLKRFGIQDPDFEPKATEHIQQMIEMIRTLIDKKHAYVAEGDVYFDVSSFRDYGQLSHQQANQMMEEVRLDHNSKKRNALDFALWKRCKEEEPSWDSPWGKGRPGWHIECSAMSLSYFKGPLDIHGGGRDLIFPHHENENAQSRCATGHLFAKLWMHHGLITIDGKKMSKSLKNFITLSDILKSDSFFGTEILKITFLGTHYSAPLDYTSERVQMDRQVWKRFMDFFELTRQKEKEGVKPSEKSLPEIYKMFSEAMDNDFNTPEVLAAMHRVIHDAYKSGDGIAQVTAALAIRNFGYEIFGIIFDQSAAVSQFKPEIEAAIATRILARKNKDFKAADTIRDRLLLERNVELRDLPDGRTTWRVKL